MSNTPGILQSSNPLFVKLKILKIKDIYSLQISKKIFNCVNNNIITNFQNWCKRNCHRHDYRTRSNYTDVNALTHSNNLHILSACTSFYGLKLIKVYGPKYWNTIPNHINCLIKILLKGFETVFIANIFLILLNHICSCCYHFNSIKNCKITKSLQKFITSIITIYYYYCYYFVIIIIIIIIIKFFFRLT